MRQVQAMIDRIGLLQIDSVNVLARATCCRSTLGLGPMTSICSRRRVQSGRAGWSSTGPGPPSFHRKPTGCSVGGWTGQTRTPGARCGPPPNSRNCWRTWSPRWKRSGPVTAGRVAAAVDPDHMSPTRATGAGTGRRSRAPSSTCSGPARITAPGEPVRTTLPTCRGGCCQHVPQAETPEPEEAIEDYWRSPPGPTGVGTALPAGAIRPPARGVEGAIERLAAAGADRGRVEGFSAPAFCTEARRPRKVEARALLAPFDPADLPRRRLEELSASTGSRSTPRRRSVATATTKTVSGCEI